MNKDIVKNKVVLFFTGLYKKLFKINDTPQKIALGLGLGVALGVLPGTGPLAALFLSILLKVNRASALLGSLITNTWLSLVTFLLALRLGSAIFNISLEALRSEWRELFNDFQLSYLLKSSFLKVILPVSVGYLIIGIVLGLSVYLIALIIIKSTKPRILAAGRKNES
ncbi:MAG: DUF2062 domain-containing protein [Candidatus Omnitrophica bacterium]|jgi:hypothetical protein|nr:DUF2062 domain-containing protein [Candidatus Omnitrophota bacterium]MDD3987718.1 DUF2062 domain-containing protein [Candidatus Omnitrophota bacterium]MDD4981830.1 DUF2062 domain-containing protein [Candidatus Omnitrophota bacterium]MDD5665148.1 DUF2062 domain-containing protein [Candidatus Omnitrophota bacterium]